MNASSRQLLWLERQQSPSDKAGDGRDEQPAQIRRWQNTAGWSRRRRGRRQGRKELSLVEYGRLDSGALAGRGDVEDGSADGTGVAIHRSRDMQIVAVVRQVRRVGAVSRQPVPTIFILIGKKKKIRLEKEVNVKCRLSQR